MPTKNRSLLTPSLVYLGATILVGLPAIMVSLAILTYLSSLVLNIASVEQLPPAVGFMLLVISVLIGLQLAVEVTAVQLGGLKALERGSPRAVIARYMLLTLSVFIMLAVVTWIGFSAALSGLGWEVILLGILVGCTGFAIIYRSVHAFIAGLQSDRR